MVEYATAETNEQNEARKQKVSDLTDMVKADLKHWEYAYKRMKEWRAFARGLQWPGVTKRDLSDADREYVANVTMRHLKQRTSAIYAKNPTYLWRKSKRMTTSLWDGSAAQLQMAQAMVTQGVDVTGYWQSIIQDAMQSRADSELTQKMGETLKCLYSYFIKEQTPPTKGMMKKQVLSSLTCGVGYVKQTFQRATEMPPDAERAIQDHMAQIARLERLSIELQDGDFDQYSADAEEMRLALQQLEQTPQIILREGLALDYPDSTNIIPDKNMTHLPGFIGCGHVTEQYCLTPDQIKEVYGVDIKDDYTSYRENEHEPISTGARNDKTERVTARVWEIWNRRDNTVYTICDGYPDYLEEPHEPITYTERFWPWFVYAPNAIDDPDDPFPPSDVELMQTGQMEINRAGEALRQHRFAARPGWATGANIPDEDVQKIESRRAHSLVVMKSLQPEEDIRAKLQAWPTSPIDMNLYQTSTIFTDILRSVGTQEANLGGTSGATATETSIAESSRQSTLGSAVDEFDDMLTDMARAGGQILLLEMSKDKVIEIVGRGAVWPEHTRMDVAKEIFLEAVAGSSGRPNQAQEVALTERLFPLLFQLPGIKHEQLVRHAVKIMDDQTDYEDWVDMTALPVVALNGQMQAAANRGGQQPSQEGQQSPQSPQSPEGAQGGSNAPAPPQPQGAGMARPGQDGFGMGGGVT